MSEALTLRPHPYELSQAVLTDHVMVFGMRDGTQFEVSGETDADELDIDWGVIELPAETVERVLDGGVYTEKCEDNEGRTYEIHVAGGDRDPKGTPIHMNGEPDEVRVR